MVRGRKRIWVFILGSLLMWGFLASPVWAAEADVVKLINLLKSKNIVTQQEADAAIQVARTTSDVQKVVTLLEIIPGAKARELGVHIEPSQPANPDSIIGG